MDWKPIETAPKDGSTLLLNGPHAKYPMLGYYNIIDDDWVAKDPVWTMGREIHIPNPTQWSWPDSARNQE
jgi:hypothetical protein